MAWITSLHDLGAASAATVVLYAVGIVAAGPAIFAVLRLIERMPHESRQASTDMDRWFDEDAPRPTGPA